MAQDTITTEKLLALKEPDMLTTEELLGSDFKPAKVDPTLPEYLKYKVNIDRASSERSKYGAEAMFGRMDNDKALTEGNKARDFWTKEAGPYDDIPFTRDPLKNVAGNVASLLPYMISSQKEGLTEGMIIGGGFATIAGIAGQVPPLTLMPEEFFTMPTAFAAGMSIGYADGVIRHTLKREGGGMYLDMIEAGISPETARPLAIAGGATIGIIELASFRTLGKPFKQALSKVIRDKVGKKAVLNAVGRYAKTIGVEIAQEELQEITSLTTETLAGMIDDKPDAIPTKKEWLQRIVETAKAMASAMPVIAAPGAILDVSSTIKNERMAQKQADLAKLDEIVKESQDQDKSQIEPIKEAEVPITPEVAPISKEAIQPDPPLEAQLVYAKALKFGDIASANTVRQMYPNWEPKLRDLDIMLAEIEKKISEQKEVIPTTAEEAKKVKKAKIAPKEIKELVVQRKLKEKLDEITDKKMRSEQAQEMLTEGGRVEEFLKGRVKRYAKGFLKEELEAFPKGFFTTKENALTPDEAIAEVNAAGLGVEFTSESDLAEYLSAWKEEKAMLKDMIERGKEKIVSRRQTTEIKQRLKDIQAGIKKGKQISKQEVKTAQSEIISLLKESNLTPKDQAKFIDTVKNVTQENLQKAMPKILDRITKLEQAEKKRSLETKIKKALKQTKPVKEGQKRVGKYDYESNKFFEELREYDKLNKSEALTKLEAFDEGDISEMDLIKRRFLSLKANGKEASAEIFARVYEDIKRMKEIGEKAKDEADFIKKMQRQEKVDDALQSIGKITADKKTIKTKIGNVYRKGFSNIYSMLNSIFGKTFAETYDPELSENTRDTAIYYKAKEMTEETARIYDTKDAVALLSRDLSRKEYTITDIDNLTTELSKLDLIDIYNSIKNDKIRERYNNAFGEAQVQSLMGELTAQDIEFADYLQETVQSYREVMNERNIEITGRDLGFVENYWPATSEYQVSVLDDIRIQGETPSALKERAKSGKIIPIPKNAWLKAQKHIAEAEHVVNLSREYETLKRLFGDRKLKHAINEKFGEDVYGVLMDQIENVSLHKQSAKIDAVSEWFGIAINNWVTSKIALNPSTYVRQLMSVGNYIENMSSLEWIKGFKEGISSPKETFDFMWKNAPFLEARFNKGYSEALARAMQGAEQLNVTWGNYTKFLSSLARYGDITAIIYGGYPVVKAELAKGKSMQEAIKTFEGATLKAQQSGLGSSISQFQNSRNPFARLFLAFKNTSNQYFRKMVDAVISFQNGDIDGTQFAKTMTIYAVIQPTLYAASGFLLTAAYKEIGQLARGIDRDDEILEDLALDIITQIAVSPVSAIPVLDDIMTFAVRKLTGQKAYQVFSTPLFDELEKAGRKLAKEEVEAKDYLEAMASILEPVTAAPANVYLRIFDYLTEKKKSAF